LYDLNEKILNILKEILDISLKIKDEAEKAAGADQNFRPEFDSKEESEADASIENIVSLVDFREELVEKTKNIELSIRHYSAELKERDPAGFAAYEKTGNKTASEIKTVLDGVKTADEISGAAISGLMAGIKDKSKAVKDNRVLMDKYTGGGEVSAAGTFFSEKK